MKLLHIQPDCRGEQCSPDLGIMNKRLNWIAGVPRADTVRPYDYTNVVNIMENKIIKIGRF